MKLLRYGTNGHEKPGVIDRDGRIRDLSGTIKDIAGDTLSPVSLDRLRRLDLNTLPLVSGSPRVGACVANVGKVVAIGLNYRKHAEEAGMAIPSEPIFFMKATSSVAGSRRIVRAPMPGVPGGGKAPRASPGGGRTRLVAIARDPPPGRLPRSRRSGAVRGSPPSTCS